MAGTGRRAGHTVADRLWKEPQRFGFFQAVRLMELMQSERARGRGGAVGADNPPAQEAVRFRTQVSLTFPPSPIVALEPAKAEQATAGAESPPAMTVAFLGLHGPAGVLPRHYTTHLLTRCHVRNRDYALRDFFDLFNHRTTSLFYRAWEKYRFSIDYERSQRASSREYDLFTHCLLCLVGLGTPGLNDRLGHDAQTVIYYGGHFAHHPRNACSLEAILCDYFDLPVRVDQFSGQWLYLSRDEQSSLPGAAPGQGRNCELGVNAIVGERVWDVQSKFRLRIGPLSYSQFARLMPQGDMLRPLCELARFYVGPEFDFDVQPILAAPEVPECHLARAGPVEPRLGWNSWLISRRMGRDAGDAVFSLQEC
jgi:type VI secretion system protein ImpH